MRTGEDYKDILKREGLKNTKHRNSILQLVKNSDQPVTAEDIFLRLKEDSVSINLSTVYRILDALVSKNLIVKTNITGDSRTFFELSHAEHTHHLVCIGCKKMFSVDGCPLDDYEKALHDRTGFDITGHKLELYGYCRDCKRDKG